MAAICNDLADMAHDSGACILIVHHTSKQDVYKRQVQHMAEAVPVAHGNGNGPTGDTRPTQRRQR